MDNEEEERIPRRFGKFSISVNLVDKSPDAVRAIMARCIVVRCEFMYESQSLEYVALCDEFELLPAGSYAPQYQCLITKKADGTGIESVEFKLLRK